MAEKRTVRIAFFGYENFGWTGGLNYLKNLLQALSVQKERKVEAFVFVSRIAEPKALEQFKPYATIITIPSFDPLEILCKISDKTLKSNKHINYVSKKYKIDAISHSSVKGIRSSVKVINWIPDFQHLHLPGFFSDQENKSRDVNFKEKISQASITVLSSNDALSDFATFAPEQLFKARVLPFVSFIDQDVYNIKESDFTAIREKYKLPLKFFYLPNQFWAHKNHLIVIEALSILKKRNVEVFVVCTGNMQTEEVSENVKMLQKTTASYHLENNVFFLGLVPYKDVQLFLRYSVSVINPSLFEGWSSTVEECKSMGKNMIISDLAVHREQKPAHTFFFDPTNALQLADVMQKNWEALAGGPDLEYEKEAKKSLLFRLETFGRNYVKIIGEVI